MFRLFNLRKKSQIAVRPHPRRIEEANMPYVNIRIAGSLTRDQKQQIATEITDTLERVALKPKSYTYIAFDELPEENWAVSGKLLDDK